MQQSQLENQYNLLVDCLRTLKEHTALMEEFYDNNQRTLAMAQIKQTAGSYCELSSGSEKTARIIEEVKQHFKDNPNDTTDPRELFKQKFDADDTGPTNVEEHEFWKVVFGYEGASDSLLDLEEVVNEPRQVEPVNFVEDGRHGLMCSQVFQPPIDSITKKVIEDPYRSRTCNHVYEYGSIVQYILSKRKGARCPYIGCAHDLKINDLIEDRELKEKIQEYASSSQGASTSR